VVEILDSTLREGEQTPGVKFTLEQKLDIALMLDEFGVDFIEAGHPAVSKDVMKAVKEIVGQNLNARILAHSRAKREDIDAVVESGAEWIGIFLGVNECSLKHKLHCSREDAFEMVADSVEYAKSNGLKVRYTPEDATRTRLEDLIGVGSIAIDAGADRISIADTVGVMTSSRMYRLISCLKKKLKTGLNVHCHNDFGMAVANSLAAYEAGVKLIDVTVNGLGERTGIAPLHKVCVALHHLYGDDGWNLEMLPGISHKVAEYSKIPIHPRMPLLGEHAFTHTADLHVKAVLGNPECYEPISPKEIGLSRTISYT